MASVGSPPRPIPELRPPFSPQQAVAEAARCLYCFDAPCTRACPANIDVAEFIKKISTGNMKGAATRLYAANVLSASCARVCPVEQLCQGRCVLPGKGAAPIAIARLQRHVTDWVQRVGLHPVKPGSPRGAGVAVVGAGPAGLTCAAELVRFGYSVTVFEQRDLPGGLATHGIADYKITPEFAAAEARWLAHDKFELLTGRTVGKDPTFDQLEQRYDAIFLGVGLPLASRLEVPGADLTGVVDALALIEASRTNAPMPAELSGKRVVIVGGGNTAVDAALLAVQHGAKKVTIVYRRTQNEMPAYAAELRLARDLDVEMLFLHSPTRILGSQTVNAAEFEPMALGEADLSGRRRPEPTGGSRVLVSCDIVVPAVGQQVDTELVSTVDNIKLRRAKVTVAPDTGQTANPKYFAGGDCVNGGREVVHAVAQGKRAARGIHQFLAKE